MIDPRHIYFIGIGGIGMSAIARYFKSRGKSVTGYDKTETILTQQLVAEGITVHYNDDIEAIPHDIDMVIYTPAIPKDHKGYNHLMQSGLPMIKRSEALGWISKGKRSVGIAGTHGKTTTSSLTTHVLKVGGVDPSAFLGGVVVDYQSNFIIGQSDVVVLEADEFDRSFLRLDPYIASILSMDADHLDIYGDSAHIEEGFKAYAAKIQDGGMLLIREEWLDRFTVQEMGQLVKRGIRILTFGEERGDVQYSDVKVVDGKFCFDYVGLGRRIDDITLSMAGRHNIENATVAISVGVEMGVSDEAIKNACSGFKGIQRRFERVIDREDVQYIDDYAHHPSELNAAISAARELFPAKKIVGIFQPHLYSRTRDFMDGFADALDRLDEIVLMDIYPARELPMEGVSSEIIYQKMKNPCKHLTDKAGLMDCLSGVRGEVYMTLGAGDIDTFVPKIKSMLNGR
jgi:UDP-N-acetylmuramate--alanine ligase